MCPNCHSAIIGWLQGIRPEYLEMPIPTIMSYKAYTCLECGYKWEEPLEETEDENTSNQG